MDTTPRLLGRGTYGPDRLPLMRGPMHIWNHTAMPPAQNSIIVYKDGTVLEGSHFAAWEIDPIIDPNIHRYIPGGTAAGLDNLDQFSIDTLEANGYTFGFGVDIDVYPGDDQYPVDDEYPLEAAP